MGELQEYKCPCCGGGIRFDSKAQKLKCPYCDTEFEIETLQQYDTTLKEEKQDDMRWDKAEGSIWQEGEEQGLSTYHCESCGGEIVADENTAASVCPFCGNPVVMTGKLSGALRPDLIIPFKLDKQAAKSGLMKHLEGKSFCRRFSKTRIILMKSAEFMCRSGCLTLRQMQTSVIAEPEPGSGATAGMTIQKPASI